MTATPSPNATSVERASQLIALTRRLTDLLAAETRAFEARRPHEAARHIDEVAQLANVYRRESARLKEQPALLAGISPKIKADLTEATQTFEAVLARHGRALEAAKTITEGLVQAIAQEVAATRAKGAGYGPTARSTAADASAVTLNRKA
jgi:hypothetical protein